MKTVEQEQQDWIVILIILVIGFLFVIIAGQLAVRFSPSWNLNTNMESHINPNSAFLTRRPSGFIEPVDASILTAPVWIDNFLTPGVSIVTGTPFPRGTFTSSPAPTTVSSATNTPVIATSPTSTLVFIPSTPSSTPKPKPTKTNPSSTDTSDTPTFVPSATSTTSSAFTATPTSTMSPTATSTPTATQTPVTIPTDSTPPEIGTTPDGNVYYLPTGGTLTLGINLVANGDGSFDLVYYERPAGGGIFLDWVIVEIGDGNNWYTVFYWGNDIADTNSNMDFNILSNPTTPPEPDQRTIPASELYNSSGIAINVDAIVPPGTYTYIRFSAPPGDSDNQMEIDAIEVLP
jgi:hypothetical protein